MQVTTIDGYPLPGDPASAIEFSGNEVIVEADVLRQGPPRRADPVGDLQAYIYTPVTVRVVTAFKGDLDVGDEIVIRALGGQIGNERTVSDLGPAPSEYVVGERLYLFTQKAVDVGDGLTASTPNFVYATGDGGLVYNLDAPEHRMLRDVFVASLGEWLAFNG